MLHIWGFRAYRDKGIGKPNTSKHMMALSDDLNEFLHYYLCMLFSTGMLINFFLLFIIIIIIMFLCFCFIDIMPTKNCYSS